jgi:uncharacterized protein YcfJ
MHKTILAAALAAATLGAFAQQPAPARSHATLCDSCGTVQSLHQEKRKGQGGAVGVIGGAVVGGLIGNQFGGGTGRTLATVGGAAAGGYVGNEVQKKVTSKYVWVTKVRMKDGSVRSFEQEAHPGWRVGTVVRADGQGLHPR